MARKSKDHPTREIIEVIGRKDLSSILGVVETAVMNASANGAFPASWFHVIDGVCRARGVDCPRAAFNFKSPAKAAAE